jgi:hypothetical protein
VEGLELLTEEPVEKIEGMKPEEEEGFLPKEGEKLLLLRDRKEL